MAIGRLLKPRTKADYMFCMVLSAFVGAFLFIALAFGPIFLHLCTSTGSKDPSPVFVLLGFLSFPIPILLCHFTVKSVLKRREDTLSAFLSDFVEVDKPDDLEETLGSFMMFRTTDDNTPYDKLETSGFIETTRDSVRIRLFELDGSILQSSFTSSTGLSHRTH